MTPARPTDFDLLMADWLDRDAPRRAPEALLPAALSRTSRLRPLPAWRLPERWLPMTAIATRRPVVPRAAYVVAIVALLALALAAVLVLVGSRPKVPPPFGPARNGQIVYIANGQLYAATPDGTRSQVLTTDGARKASMAFSRDGLKLVYRAASASSPADEPFKYSNLIVADADGSHPRVLLRDSELGSATWSPDGRYLTYSGPKDGTDHAFVIAVEDATVTDLGDFGGAGGGAWTPSWSPDGTQLAVAVGDGTLWLINRDGTGAHRISKGEYDEVGGPKGETAAWNPDGRSLLFSALRGDTNLLYLIGLDGTEERLIEVDSENAVWAPDGTRFAYERASPYGATIVIADYTGRRLWSLPGNYGWYLPVWSPDGAEIAIRDDTPGAPNTPGPPLTVILDVTDQHEPVVIQSGSDLDTENTRPDVSVAWQRLALQ